MPLLGAQKCHSIQDAGREAALRGTAAAYFLQALDSLPSAPTNTRAALERKELLPLLGVYCVPGLCWVVLFCFVLFVVGLHRVVQAGLGDLPGSVKVLGLQVCTMSGLGCFGIFLFLYLRIELRTLYLPGSCLCHRTTVPVLQVYFLKYA